MLSPTIHCALCGEPSVAGNYSGIYCQRHVDLIYGADGKTCSQLSDAELLAAHHSVSNTIVNALLICAKDGSTVEEARNIMHMFSVGEREALRRGFPTNVSIVDLLARVEGRA